jgi:hypothetical protein
VTARALGASLAGDPLFGTRPVKNDGTVVTGAPLGALLAGAALGAYGETVVTIAVGASLAGVTVLGTTFIVKKGGRVATGPAVRASVTGAPLLGKRPIKNDGTVVTGRALGALLAGAALTANGEIVETIALGASLSGVAVFGTVFLVNGGRVGKGA